MRKSLRYSEAPRQTDLRGDLRSEEVTDAETFGTKPAMRKWLDERLAQLPGKNKTGLAKAMGTTGPRVSEMLAGGRRIQEHEWQPMADYLEWTVEQLHRIDRTGSIDKTDQIRPVAMQEGPIDLPLWACEPLHEGGGFRITPKEQDVVERPSRLRFSAFAFAFWIFGSELTPAFEAGDTVIIDPSRPVSPGNDCLFVRGYQQGSEEPFEGIVRRLLREEPDSWVVRLYDNTDEIQLSKADWDRALFIYGKYSRT